MCLTTIRLFVMLMLSMYSSVKSFFAKFISLINLIIKCLFVKFKNFISSCSNVNNVFTFCGIQSRIRMRRSRRILLILAKLKNCTSLLMFLSILIADEINYDLNLFTFISNLLYWLFAMISYIYYIANENHIVELLNECEQFARLHRRQVKRRDKYITVMFMVIFLVDLVLLNLIFYGQPSDLFYNILHPCYFTAFPMSMAIIYEKCGNCIQLGEKSILVATVKKDETNSVKSTIDFIVIDRRLTISRVLRQKVNRLGVYPFLWITMLLLASFEVTIDIFVNQVTFDLTIIDKSEPIILFTLIMLTLCIRFQILDSNRPKIEDLDRLIGNRGPPNNYQQQEALDRIRRDLTTNNIYGYTVLFIYPFDIRLIGGILTIVFSFIIGFTTNIHN